MRQDSSGYESSREAAAFGFASGELAEQIRHLRARKGASHNVSTIEQRHYQAGLIAGLRSGEDDGHPE